MYVAYITKLTCSNNFYFKQTADSMYWGSLKLGFVTLNGYELIRLDRSWTSANSSYVKKGGGVCIYINKVLRIDNGDLGTMWPQWCVFSDILAIYTLIWT